MLENPIPGVKVVFIQRGYLFKASQACTCSGKISDYGKDIPPSKIRASLLIPQSTGEKPASMGWQPG